MFVFPCWGCFLGLKNHILTLLTSLRVFPFYLYRAENTMRVAREGFFKIVLVFLCKNTPSGRGEILHDSAWNGIARKDSQRREWYAGLHDRKILFWQSCYTKETSIFLSLGLDVDTLQFNKTIHGVTSWISKKNLFKFPSGLSRFQLCWQFVDHNNKPNLLFLACCICHVCKLRKLAWTKCQTITILGEEKYNPFAILFSLKIFQKFK